MEALDSVTDELYGVSPDDFTRRRTELAAEAKAAGDKDLAKLITGLRKPTRSAWLVNLLARGAADDLAGLLELGAALLEAQQSLAGDDLRRLSRQRHEAVAQLVQRAATLGLEHGWTAPEGARQEVSQTLQAALSDPPTSAIVQAGRLVQATSYGGFGPGDVLAAVSTLSKPSRPTPLASPASKAPAADDQSPGRQGRAHLKVVTRDLEAEAAAESAGQAAAAEARRTAEERLATVTATWDEAQMAADAGETAAEAATARADELADLIESLQEQLKQAELDERQAREDARTARRDYQRLAHASSAAAEKVKTARETLDALKP